FSTIMVATPLLHFTAITDTGETATFTLDTSVPNGYDPIQFPPPAFIEGGVYLNAVRDLTFEGETIPLTDLTTTPGSTGNGIPLSILNVGPAGDISQSLALELVFADTSLVSPLQTDPTVYQRTFLPAPGSTSVLFPQTPPPRT